MTKEDILIKPLRDKSLTEDLTNYINKYGVKALMEVMLKAIDNSKSADIAQ